MITYHILYFNKETDIYATGKDVSGKTLEDIISKFKIEHPDVTITSISLKK